MSTQLQLSENISNGITRIRSPDRRDSRHPGTATMIASTHTPSLRVHAMFVLLVLILSTYFWGLFRNVQMVGEVFEYILYRWNDCCMTF